MSCIEYHTTFKSFPFSVMFKLKHAKTSSLDQVTETHEPEFLSCVSNA